MLEYTGLFPPDIQPKHIGAKELYAVLEGILVFGSKLMGCTLVLFCDNLPAVYMLKKWATKSITCHTLVCRIAAALRRFDIVLDIRWVASKDNPADAPSRALVSHLYSLPGWFMDYVRAAY